MEELVTKMPRRFSKLRLLIILIVSLVIYIEKCLWMASKTKPPPPYGSNLVYMTMDHVNGRRLGNMMFSYASLVGISRRHNAIPILSSNFRLYKIFNLTLVKPCNVTEFLGEPKLYKEKYPCKYDKKIELFTPKADYSLRGYYQSFRYFEGHSKTIRQDFQFKPDILERAKRFFQNQIGSIRQEATIVGIHVRRGDLLESYYESHGYVVPGAEYFQLAREFFRTRLEKVHFVVCTDDKQWAESNVQGDDVTYSTEKDEVTDMAILSMCDHTIVSLGTFGWWAAWLANGTTVYFSGWPKALSPLDRTFDKRDFFPPKWISIP